MATRNETTYDAGLDSPDGTYVGARSTSKVGFYGATPIARQELASDADLADVIAALVALGVVTQAA